MRVQRGRVSYENKRGEVVGDDEVKARVRQRGEGNNGFEATENDLQFGSKNGCRIAMAMSRYLVID